MNSSGTSKIPLQLQRYLKGTSESEVTTKMKKKYSTPIPVEIVFTKKECSATYSDVIDLQQEYGFEYAAAVGSPCHNWLHSLRANLNTARHHQQLWQQLM
jgi:hypothetical protein